MDQESVGRLHLWMGALSHCKACLDDAAIIEKAADSAPVVAEREATHAHFKRLTSRDYDPHVAHPGDEAVLRSAPRRLPTPSECRRISFHLERLAVVYFLQIYKAGYRAERLVAGNHSPKATALRARLEILAFPALEDARRFAELRRVLEEARDGIIGHADGGPFYVGHSEGGVSSVEHGVAEGLIAELRDAATKLYDAGLALALELQAEA